MSTSPNQRNDSGRLYQISPQPAPTQNRSSTSVDEVVQRGNDLRIYQPNDDGAQPPRPASNALPVISPIITFDEKEQKEKQHWSDLKAQLLENKTEFATGPLQAHVQFSNYCNLSCIMCWNGNNPRTKKITPELLEKVETQLGPHLSVIVPFSGSEPLILTWDETRAMAEKYGVMLRVTSNLQFLDEPKFNELKGITETLCVSVDCHIPEVLAKIRLRAKTDTILTNLATTARLARENNIECIVNVVLVTYNTPFLPDTLRYFNSIGIENVDVIQMVDVNHDSHFIDPMVHYSDEYMNWIQNQCVDVCKENKMRLLWNVGDGNVFDFRENPVQPNPRKVNNDHNDWLLKHYVPGFCKHAYNRMRFEIDGDIAPCFFATEGQLSLGNLNERNFDEIWNGVNAQDLRRGMYTGDVPSLCQSCRVRDPLPQQTREMNFIHEVKNNLNPKFFRNGIDDSYEFSIDRPEHNLRTKSRPVFKATVQKQKYKFLLALSLGGSTDHIETVLLKSKPGTDKDGNPNGKLKLEIPKRVWERLKPNLGYWWTMWQYGGKNSGVIWSGETRCLIRHQPMPRLPGSTLGYEDEGHKAVTHLGVDKSLGFTIKESE